MPVLSADDDTLGRLEKCIRRGDWNAVAALGARLDDENPPMTAAALGERLRRLREVLIAARIARSGLSLALGRLRAAAGFAHSRTLQARHGFGDSPES